MAIDWTPIYKKYKGKWVGLGPDYKTVVSNGNSVKVVLEQAKKKGIKPILFKVPSEVLPYVGKNE